MKKLAIIAIILLATTAYAETSKFGSMWKQEGATIYPADDVTYVDFTGYTTVGVGGVSGNFVSYSTSAGTTFANITTDTHIKGRIIGGTLAYATGNYAGVFGGYSNVVAGESSFIGAGTRNTISNTYAGILGGGNNNVTSSLSAIVGGNANSATNTYAVVVAGSTNTASGTLSAVVGGSTNIASGSNASIVGGAGNLASGNYGFIGGGQNNVVSRTHGVVGGGLNNDVIGDYSNVLGGRNAEINGEYSSVLGGYNATLSATADRTTVDIYGTASVNVTVPDAHIIYGAAGFEKSVGIQTLAPQSALHVEGHAQYAFNTITSSPFSVDRHFNLSIDASDGSRELDLIDCTTLLQGRTYRMIAFNVTSSIALDPAAGDSIHDGATDANYNGLDTTREVNDFICDGADNWIRFP